MYNKLKNPLIKYYDFYLYLYIATRNSLVDKNNAVLESLYACKDDFFNQLLLTNPFYKSGCFLDIDVTKKLFDLLILHPENSEEIDKIMNEKTNLPWYKCWSKEGTEFYNSILQIERDFPTFFPNDLLEIIETLLNIIEPQKNMVDFVGGKAILDFLPIQNIHMPELPTNYILEAYNLEEILRLLDEIMSYIEKDSTLVLRHKDVDFFNNRNTGPQIGYSCDINII